MRVFFLLTVLCVFCFGREVLEIETSSYQIKKVDAFGLEITYAEHTIRYNEPLAQTVPVICPQFDCSDQEAIDTICICNYASTDPAVCGIIPTDCPNSCDLSRCNR